MTNHTEEKKEAFYSGSLCACLPFVTLAKESMVSFGPVQFWVASAAKERIPDSSLTGFQAYIEAIGQFKAVQREENVGDQCSSYINTTKIAQEKMTFISIDDDIACDVRELLLLDALYLLYFACTFKNLYYGQKAHSFNAFRKIVPASLLFIENKSDWEELFIHESDREENICVHIVDPDICNGLGKALEAVYRPLNNQDPERGRVYKRIVRSIRYMIDRSFPRCTNLLDRGFYFSDEMFESENILFLTASFESLFDLNESQGIAADFKHHLRPLLHLKYTRPIEIFWKWVDEFYALKREILCGESLVDPIFRYNPNFEVSHILLGTKLFVYSIYYYLYSYDLLASKHVDPYTPPDFKWIHPEEILLFFWTEQSVLDKISSIIQQCVDGFCKEEAQADLSLLTTLFVSLYDRYYLSEKLSYRGNQIRFIPTPIDEIKQHGQVILRLLEEMQVKNSDNIELQFIHPYFIQVLKDRLEEKKIPNF